MTTAEQMQAGECVSATTHTHEQETVPHAHVVGDDTVNFVAPPPQQTHTGAHLTADAVEETQSEERADEKQSEERADEKQSEEGEEESPAPEKRVVAPVVMSQSPATPRADPPTQL
jgi:hypothetical protein